MEDQEAISFLTQQQAAEIDDLLMGHLGFSIDQLMELAGLSVASAIAEVYKPSKYNRVLVMETTVVMVLLPLVICIILDISRAFVFPNGKNPGPPFDDLIHSMSSLREHSPVIISVDIPSGWHVEDGDLSGEGIKPDMLVSLTAPKLCAKTFRGPYHFVGGRFVPPFIVQKYKLKLPSYPGTSMCVQIRMLPQVNVKADDPFVQFRVWFDDAVSAGLKEPNIMALSTASKDGNPSSRMVQLKEVNQGGFVWCSNYESRKGREISENPHAALLFYWSALNRQVRIEGFVQKVTDEESEQYFCSRPREIQIAPAVSNQVYLSLLSSMPFRLVYSGPKFLDLFIQSTEVTGREFLQQQCKEMEEKYPEGSMIPRPQHWGGYRLIPERFEFWQGDESSLQIKLRYFTEDIDGRKEWRIVVQ